MNANPFAGLAAELALLEALPTEKQLRWAILAIDHLHELPEDMRGDGLAVIRAVLVTVREKVKS